MAVKSQNRTVSSSPMCLNRSARSALVPRVSITNGAAYVSHNRLISAGAWPVPSMILSSCVVTLPSSFTMPAEMLVWVASTSTATPNTTGRAPSSLGLIGGAVVVAQRSASITLSVTPSSRWLPNARAQPLGLFRHCSRKSGSWSRRQSRPAAGW